ncbi:MAG: proline--tRNA ligase [Cellulosilyticum sp.]|nr:proline--tRNA ligase [Cellulosilyticum sp.]MEE1071153.1 proline--tRNA ligase [Cellulosilyticum sp.]
MLMSKLLGERFKEKPSEATSTSHVFLLRGGYVRQVTNGIYTLLPPAKRIAAKIENIIREEMDAIDGQEVLFPVALPGDLWKESGRFEAVGSELVRFKDRANKDMILGMTHEEAAVHLARSEAKSYADYPFMIYQIQTKFRDEPRARGGLIRVREFTMKDAYSFHTSQEDLEQYYDKCYDAYHKIYARAGVPEVISVKSDTGMMGGKVAHEFMLLTDIGEDTLVICDSCDYRSNMEVAVGKLAVATTTEAEIKEVETPNMKTIEEVAGFLNVPVTNTLKACVFAAEGQEKPVIVFIRGDLQVNTSKLEKITKAAVTPFEDYENTKNLCFGFMGPYGLDAQGATVIFDASLKDEKNLVAGGNKVDVHITGISMSREFPEAEYVDVAEVFEGQECSCCHGKLQFKRGVEVGNIFQLGTRYTESMGMTYVDKDGKAKTPIMGCYGIGVGRLLACIIEARHDDYGPIWPMSVAPWQVHICVLKSKKQDMNVVGMDLYNKLNKKFEVIVDDRDVAAGAQFADADLLGVPVRVVVGEKNLANGQVELVTRDKSVKKLVAIEDIEKEVAELVEQLSQM